jgi:NADH:ubiquinone oxidoreductase subunit K
VASARIRGAGPFESQPVVFHWPWYWHLCRLGPWALLALAVAVPKRNRDRQVLLIFVPLVILTLLWPVVTRPVAFSSVSLDRFSLLFESLVVGLALLWLYADRLRGYRGWVRVPLSLGLMLLAGLVAFVSVDQTLSDPMIIILPIFVTILGAVLLAALALARRLTRGRDAPLPFMGWLAIWSLLFTAVSAVLLAGIPQFLSSGVAMDLRIRILVWQGVAGLALGLCLYVINLPYMLLMFRSSFFRQRFRVWLGVEPLLPQGQAASPEGPCAGSRE